MFLWTRGKLKSGRSPRNRRHGTCHAGGITGAPLCASGGRRSRREMWPRLSWFLQKGVSEASRLKIWPAWITSAGWGVEGLFLAVVTLGWFGQGKSGLEQGGANRGGTKCVGSGLVGLHLKIVLKVRLFTLSRNWVTLGGAVKPVALTSLTWKLWIIWLRYFARPLESALPRVDYSKQA